MSDQTNPPDRRALLQSALQKLQEMQARVDQLERAQTEPIAIIGLGCRFPGGADDPDRYWALLRDGVNAVREVPPDRWDVDAYYDPNPETPGKSYTRFGGFLDQIDRFDPQFFGISPREAVTLDPQQRLTLEVGWEALEHAGQAAPARLRGSRTGVFVGAGSSDYGQLQMSAGVEGIDAYTGSGAGLCFVAGRVSYCFGLQGPSLSVDTACSSSLVAVHLACQSLRASECDMALAGGVNIIAKPDLFVYLSKLKALAADGRSKVFDAAADGFVRGEGCGMIVLKRLSAALADGDTVLAVIRGSAVNQDGASSGLTVPNGPAQEAVITEALAHAGADADDIDYIEAFGTGTALGDPIEVGALVAALGAARSPDRPLMLASVKTNLGHLEAAAGIAGLIKVVLALQHGEIPPHLHYQRLNPAISFGSVPFVIPTTRRPWAASARRRLAGISSFGLSGTNAHVVVEEAPLVAAPLPTQDRPPHLLALSARSATALTELAARYALYLERHPELSLGDVCFSANTGRAHFGHRVAIVASTTEQLRGHLAEFGANERDDIATGVVEVSRRPKVAFLFTGQGAQYAGMGRALYESEPVFRAALDACAEILRVRLDRPLLELLFPAVGAHSAIAETAYTQPALFALEYALTELWRSWGITPSVVVGHGVGEYVAACVAGVFSLEDGLALIAERGRLMQALPAGGGMAAVFASESAVGARVAALGDRLAIAAVNGPEEVVVSGDADALRLLLERCEADGIKGRALEVSHAFHSARLDPMLDAFERRAAEVAYEAPRMPLVSNLTGQLFAPGTRPDAAYWRRHARGTVRFSACADALRTAGINVLLEVGPHPTLLGLAGRAAPDANWTALASLRRGRDDRQQMLASLGTLYARGAAVQWDAVMAGRGRRIALPTYPFQRERYWVAGAERDQRASNGSGHPLLGTRQPSPHPGAQFLATVACDRPAFLAEHVVLGHVFLPGTAYIEMALAATRATGVQGPTAIRAFTIESPLRLERGVGRLLHTEVGPPTDGSSRFIVRSASVDASDVTPWQVHAKGVIQLTGAREPEQPVAFTVGLTRERCDTPIDVTDYYERLQRVGLSYGPTFKGLRALHVGRNEGVGLLDAAAFGESGPWTLHPALLDAAFHVLGGILLSDTSSQDAGVGVYVPVGIEEIFSAGPAPATVWVAARIRPSGGHASVIEADLRLEDEAGRVVVQITGLGIRRITADSVARTLALPAPSTQSYVVRLREAAVEARPELMGRYLRAEVARVLGLATDRLSPSPPLSSFGFDSLMAVQLKNRIETDLGVALPMIAFLEGSSVEDLSATLLRTVDLTAPSPDLMSVPAVEAWEEGSL